MAPPTSRPRDPFSSARLVYRNVRIPEDLALFTAINNDQIGYINSNASNIRLPTSSDAETFQKSVAESFLGTVIWLPTSTSTSTATTEEGNQQDQNVNNVDTDNTNLSPGPQKIHGTSQTGVPIGQIHLKGLPAALQHHRSAEIGVDILPSYQGRGYGAEAITWILDYAFRRAGLHRVRIRAFGWNEGAIRLYEKLGFRHEGREREALWHEGRFWDGIEMSLLEGEWWELQKGKEKEQGKKGDVPL